MAFNVLQYIGYSVTATSNQTDALLAFDSSTSTFWQPSTSGATESLTLDLGNSTAPKGYSICPADTVNNAITGWLFQGSNNATAWTTIDTKANITTGWTNEAFRYFSVVNTVLYRYLRIVFNAQPASRIKLAGFEVNRDEYTAYIDGTGPTVPSSAGYKVTANDIHEGNFVDFNGKVYLPSVAPIVSTGNIFNGNIVRDFYEFESNYSSGGVRPTEGQLYPRGVYTVAEKEISSPAEYEPDTQAANLELSDKHLLEADADSWDNTTGSTWDTFVNG